MLWSFPLSHQAPAILSLYAHSYNPLTRGLLLHHFQSAQHISHTPHALPHQCLTAPWPFLRPFPSRSQFCTTFLTFPCLPALCERSLPHLMRVNHSVITTSSLLLEIRSPPPTVPSALFPFHSSLLTISFVQQAASNLIFTIWKTREPALKSSPPPYLIQILQPCGDELVLSVI